MDKLTEFTEFLKKVDLEVKNFRVAEIHRHLGVGSALETMLYSFAKTDGFKKI